MVIFYWRASMPKMLNDIFEVDSVMKTLLLCLLTLGGYLIYKLYAFSKKINNNTTYKIPTAFMVISIALFTLSLVSLIYGLLNLDNPEILRSSIALHLVSTIFDVSWIVMVRNRMNLISGAVKGDSLWLNPVITSIFHVVYMQYKINQGGVNNMIKAKE